ncbi:MAG: glutamate--tRNA ligase [Patescibacteria group bacterium]
MTAPVRVRFAPSPTGLLHIGGARTAIYDWLLARATGGAFILRIEDTDRNRFVPGALQDIMDSLRWLGLQWDEGPEVGGPYGSYFQSERLPLYQSHARRLIDEGKAYYCFCTAERLAALRAAQEAAKSPSGYDRLCRGLPRDEAEGRLAKGEKAAVRFKTPLTGSTVFADAIRGEITVENRTLDDMVLLKSDGFPTYHLAAIVDDHEMRITHVLRGDEWLSSAPRHILLYRAFGWEPPVFAHLPVFLNPSGSGKMSKRHGATSVREYREKGYLPEALFNFLLLLGWHPQEEREIYDPDEAARVFTLDRVSKAPVALSFDKLDWFNGIYLRKLQPEDLARRCLPFLQAAGLLPEPCPPERFAYLAGLIPLVQERLTTLAEAPDHLGYFLQETIPLPPSDLLCGKKTEPVLVRAILTRAVEIVRGLEVFDEASLESALAPLAAEFGLKKGEVFMPMRVAVSGRTATPGLFETMAAIGRERCLARLQSAANALER